MRFILGVWTVRGRCAGGVMPLATIDLVGDNREFEV